jgi:phosphatidylserine/phosphatidylglycerophosphate/cardiolipin synthase-like enzyme
MTSSVLSRVDAVVGDGIEAAVTAKHAWRLRRLGWERALHPDGEGLWAQAEPRPRPGCDLRVLIDGARALPEIASALGEAREFVHITGWHVAPHFELVRSPGPVVLGALLAELAQRVDVRVLVWAGAPVPAFHPTRAEVRETVENLVRGTRIRCEPDPREHPFHCHHEKTVVIDGRRADDRGELRSLSGSRDDRLYVHAKVGIVDDRWLTIGSANLNAHSLLNDTEMNVATVDERLARDTRVRLWAEHLELPDDTVAGSDARALVDEHWRPIADEQLGRRDRGAPPTHRLLAMPGVSRRSRRLLGPLEGLIADG